MDKRFANGFTLVEMIVTVGIAATAFLAMASMSNYFSMGLSRANHTDDVSNVMNKVTDAFSNSDNYCHAILGNRPLTLTTPTTLTSIDYHDAAETFQGNVLTAGQPVDSHPDLTVQSIQLKPFSLVSSDPTLNAQTILANLEVTFTGVGAAGPSTTTRRIPIWTFVQNGKISICSTSPTNSFTVQNLLCQVRNNGYAYYDPAQPDCQYTTEVQWYPSATPSTAICPAGKEVSAEIGDPSPEMVNCKNNAPMSVNLPPRSYDNGYVDSDPQSSSTYSLNIQTSTCTFSFVAGSSMAGIVSQIRCRPSI